MSCIECAELPVARRTTAMDNNGFYLHFAGQVTIEFHVEKETNFIVLHIQDLNITEKVILFRSKTKMQTYGLASMQAPARTSGTSG